MRIRLFVIALAASVTGLVTAASANSYNLFCNGTGCGTVNISNISGGVDVSVNMTGGFSIQAAAHNSFTLNTIGGLTPTPVTMVTTTNFGAVTANFVTNVHDGAGAFTFGVDNFGIPHGNTSVTGISFNLLGISTSSLLANSNGNVVAVHFCSPGSPITSCPSPTGFTTSKAVAPIPEPGTLGLLGTGLFGLAGLARRKLKLGT